MSSPRPLKFQPNDKPHEDALTANILARYNMINKKRNKNPFAQNGYSDPNLPVVSPELAKVDNLPALTR